MNAQDEDSRSRPIIDELMIDIYANPILKTVAILIDRPFEEKLTGLELDSENRKLFFLFGDKKRDLGDPLKENLVPFFQNRRHIEVYQMDVKTKKPVEAWQVPLKIIQ